MAPYTRAPVTLLSLVSFGSSDDDPPFNYLEVNWRGTPIPFLQTIQVQGRPPYLPTVTITVLPDYTNESAEKVAAARVFWRAMQKEGIIFTNFPSLTEELVRVGLRACKKEREISASGASSIAVKDLLEAGLSGLPDDLEKEVARAFLVQTISSRALQSDFVDGRHAHFWEQANKVMEKLGHPKVTPVPIDAATL